MIRPDHLLVRLLLVASSLGTLDAGQVRQAQGEEEPPKRARPRSPVPISDENFDLWVLGNPDSVNAAQAKFELILRSRIQVVDGISRLTEAEEKKLQLAGRGDIKRLLEQAKAARGRLNRVKGDPVRIELLLKELGPLRLAINREPFGEGSLFTKAIKGVMSGDRAANYDRAVRVRSQLPYHTLIDLVVAKQAKQLGLGDDDRRRFARLIRDETRPPGEVRGFGRIPNDDAVILQEASIPEAKLRPIFDEKQWAILNESFKRVRAEEEILRKHQVSLIMKHMVDAE